MTPRRPLGASGDLRAASQPWGDVLASVAGSGREELWRLHLQRVYRDLLEGWGAVQTQRPILKTDLFDEAVSRHGLSPLLARTGALFVGADCSRGVARAAVDRAVGQDRQARFAAVVADVRALPFRDSSFGAILSLSTLDHFSQEGDISVGLRELRRVLEPGGTAIVTLDNPRNPLIALRNALPPGCLRTLGLIPFAMGATLSGASLASALADSGFHVDAKTAIVHSPRVLGIWVGALVHRTGGRRLRSLFLALLRALERVGRLGARGLTGHYVAVRAKKPV